MTTPSPGVSLETVATRYWLATIPMLMVALATGGLGFLPVAALTVAQGIHYTIRERSATAFSVQVRLAYLALLALSLLPHLVWIAWAQLAGTTVRVIFNYCILARTVSLLPWNRSVRLTGSLILRTFLTPPTQNSILDVLSQQPYSGGGK